MPSLPLKTQLLSLRRPPGTFASELSCSLLPPLLWSSTSLLDPPLTRPRQFPGAKTPGGYEPRADRWPLPEASAPLGRSAPETPLAAVRLGQRAERPPSLSWDQRSEWGRWKGCLCFLSLPGQELLT
ncbi:hypothetical protein E5288_WYG007734 [Bos mutus]|uniref:Uncharacterized protein n=1 Tax=Bos mutus TaxID=72004 RepID=A0A6B0RCD1_9CETA|nr:hypothetical protein [Bos mutus]